LSTATGFAQLTRNITFFRKRLNKNEIERKPRKRNNKNETKKFKTAKKIFLFRQDYFEATTLLQT
jgi:hypothetical protein